MRWARGKFSRRPRTLQRHFWREPSSFIMPSSAPNPISGAAFCRHERPDAATACRTPKRVQSFAADGRFASGPALPRSGPAFEARLHASKPVAPHF
jgi:hypothetical protein